MIKRFLFIVGILPIWAMAQNLTLDECLRMARRNYPAVKQYGLIEQTRDFNLANAAKGWLPQISLSAGAYAFTDIVKEDIMSAMGTSLKNQVVSGSVTINQHIYDGGQIAASRRVARAQSEVEKQQLDVSMYDLNERVQQLYFGILMLNEQVAQNHLLQKDLDISYQSIESMMRGGIANQSDLDAIKVEQIKAEQQLGSLENSRKAYRQMLGIFIGRDIGQETVLRKPEGRETLWAESLITRPELTFYTAQSQLLDEQRKQLNTKLRPTISAFGMGMLHNSVSTLVNNSMLIGGISINWNIGALYTRKNDLRKLEAQRETIEAQRNTFLFNNRLQNESSNGAIESLKTQIRQDDEIVRLRESIRSKSEKKVEMGTESVNEMLRDINAVSEARQQKALHEIELMKEIYNQRHIMGADFSNE